MTRFYDPTSGSVPDFPARPLRARWLTQRCAVGVGPMLTRLATGLMSLGAAMTTALANPMISEFVADNVTGLTDSDGTRQDWIEIHNPTAAAIDLSGWHLTDSATNPIKWRFPAVTLNAGGYLVVFASGKNRTVVGAELHTNFSLRAGGEYLALVAPDGATRVQEYSPQYPPQDPDRSFGPIFSQTTLVADGAAGRYRVPTTAAAVPATWNTTAFSDTAWTAGATGHGYGLLVPGMTMTYRKKNTTTGALNTQVDALTLISRATGHADIGQEVVRVEPTFNVLGEGADGHYPANAVPPLTGYDDYVARATGFIQITTPGVYTFGINSDDGCRISINGAIVRDDPTLHGPQDSLGTVTLPVGLHSFDAWFWERGGGDEGEFFAAQGSFTAWNPTNFRLVGDTANGGLPSFAPLGAGSASLVRTNVQSAMQGVNSTMYLRVPFTVADKSLFRGLNLRMRSNDGFAAWINGVPVGSLNAPAITAWNSAATATRSLADSLLQQGFNASAALGAVVNGTNVLAIQGLNSSAADTTFLLHPELTATTGISPDSAYYNTPTPAGTNTNPSTLGKVADTVFSPRRGIYPDAVVTAVPFPVTITTATPGAAIYYTTDGSKPTLTNGTLYTVPISITQTTTLRAAAFRTGWEETNADTHTYIVPDDVVTQPATPPPGWPPAGAGLGQLMDYGMDPDIVNNTNPAIGGAAQVKAALRAIPSISVVLNVADLVGKSNGTTWDETGAIYMNPYARGLGAERPCSIELINDPTAAGGGGGFQVNAGLRLRGGYSRSEGNPKHAFKFYFRDEYGASKLRYPLFGAYGTEEFNQVDLRTSQNYSWSFGGDGQNTFLREEFTRRTQTDLGQPGSHVKYCHLYLNGQYWGLFNFDERTEADHSATYVGGLKENWDVVKAEQDSGYVTGVTDGNLTAWHQLFEKANPLQPAPAAGFLRRSLTEADYFALQGLAADGVTRTTDPVLLDVDNLIDYMLITFWSGNFDGATSAFLGNETANNWFGARDRTGNKGFIFYVHDFEHSLFNVDEDRTGPFDRDFTAISPTDPVARQNRYNEKRNYYNPMFLHKDLLDVPRYKRRWAERVQMHLFNHGKLSLTENLKRLDGLAAVVDSAIIAESARWGDAISATPLTRVNWQGARDYLRVNYMPNRTSRVINQLRADGLYPSIDAVTAAPYGPYIDSGRNILLSHPGYTAGTATIYYTLDGSDPMRPDGTRDPAAIAWVGGTTQQTTLIEGGDVVATNTWKYRDPSLDLGSSDIVVGHPSWSASNWKHPQFVETVEWKSGATQMGANDGDERTVINVGPTGARYPVMYFRRTFTVTNPTQFDTLTLDLKRDDGAIVFINGREVGRSSIQGGTLGYEYIPSFVVGGVDENAWFNVVDPRITPSVLVNGVNTICVQVHQANASSSDLSFDCRLRASKTVPTQPINFASGQHVLRARAQVTATGEFSALIDPLYLINTVAAAPTNLVISEIHYHPQDPTATEFTNGWDDENFFEYVELQNVGTQPVDLAGARFIAGLTFTFPAGVSRVVAPGERVLVVAHEAAFVSRFGAGRPVVGVFTGQLDNGGERIHLISSEGATLIDMTYGDLFPWPSGPDGSGQSLVLVRPQTRPDLNVATNWRSSLEGPTPGFTDATNYSQWKTANTIPAGTPGDQADLDHDGLSSLLEYALGGQANAPGQADTFRLPVARVETIDFGTGAAPYLLIEIRRRLSAEDVAISAQLSTGLSSWSSQGVVEFDRSNNGDGTETIRFRQTTPYRGEERVFLRGWISLQ